MSYIKINLNEVNVGQALPWAVFDGEGKLLLRKGYILNSRHQLEVLMERGLFRNKSEEGASNDDEEFPDLDDQDLSPFQMVTHICGRLQNVFDSYQAHPDKFVSSIMRISDDVLELCKTDPDAGLGAVHLYNDFRYTVIHPVHQALIAAIVASAREMDDDTQRSLIAGALTANIAMNELQEELHTQTDPLTDEQRDRIYDHPDEGFKLLRKLGVKDELWLRIVEQHHERVDGSGYPASLQSDEICLEAKLVAIADRYTAMVSTRNYRQAIHAKDALKNFFVSKGKEFDEELSLFFIKCLGIFSPGTFVKLANNEIGVVIRRCSDNSMNPVVSCFVTPSGGHYVHPFIRDTSDTEFAIRETCEKPQETPLNLHILWGYN